MQEGLHTDLATTPAQRVFLSWAVDVLIYVAVLNLWVEWSPNKTIDSFTISILTAALLKVLLDLVTTAKGRVLDWARRGEGRSRRVAGLFGVWAILFFSKFLILEAVDIVFGDRVTLGSFVDVLLLAATLMLARQAMAAAYRRLG
ncbi:MAG: hypothetical protein AB1Z55_03535 [Acidimicrobiia bacterium]